MINDARLARFGFRLERGGVHLARTMMLAELETLLAAVERPEAEKGDYLRAVEVENRLGKRSGKTRSLTFRHLASLYGLDPSIPLFRNFRFFWKRDPAGRPLLALLCAYARDAVLRSATPFLFRHPIGAPVSREALETFLDATEPDRFSPATRKSTAQNINSTWTQSGHLTGRVRKIRARPVVTAGIAAYALFLGYLTGARGEALFHTEFARLLDAPPEKVMELAAEASRKGWIVFKRAGDVVEALFPGLIPESEMEWLRE